MVGKDAVGRINEKLEDQLGGFYEVSGQQGLAVFTSVGDGTIRLHQKVFPGFWVISVEREAKTSGTVKVIDTSRGDPRVAASGKNLTGRYELGPSDSTQVSDTRIIWKTKGGEMEYVKVFAHSVIAERTEWIMMRISSRL